MQLTIKHTTLLLSLCAALAACSEQDVLTDNPSGSGADNGKTPIELSVGGVEGNTGVMTKASASAVITQNETGMINFPENTNIFMVMESEYDTNNADFGGGREKKTTVTRGYVAKGTNAVTFDAVNTRYWDDAHARSSQLSIWAYAQMYKTNWTSCTFQKVVDSTKEGWEMFDDDTYFTSGTSNSYDWNQGNVYPGIKYWSVTHNSNGEQDGTSILCQDLLFSNNIANNTEYSKGDNRLKFNFTSRKFPENPMMYFRHAMSKITIHIIEGDGFIKTGDNANSDFKFTPNTTNVKLTNFNTKGVFNIKEGEFQWVWPANEADATGASAPREIPKIYQHTTADASDAYTLEALAIPNIHAFKSAMKNGDGNSLGLSDIYSRFVSNGTSTTMMEFTIDGNKYEISSKQLYDALKPNGTLVTNATEKTDYGTYIPLEAGKNYVFTFRVSKTGVSNITAQVADWETVTANQIIPSNARITLKLEERGSDSFVEGNQISIYRAEDNPTVIMDNHVAYNWATGYTATGNSNTLTKTSGAWTFPVGSPWYWPNNKTYYHFRALSPTTQTVQTANSEDYTTLTSAMNYTDVLWGAPMLDDADNETNGSFKWTYDVTNSNGFDVTNSSLESDNHQIYHAIGPTDNALKLILFHMMSKVKFTITTNDSQSDKVVLGDGTGSDYTNKTKLELVDYYRGGTLLMGNGMVAPTVTSPKATDILGPIYAGDGNNNLTWGIVPQSLEGVKLRITTPDHNQYVVTLKDIYVTTEPTTTNIANPYTVSGGKYTIDRWYPGFKYNYTLNLTKKGIIDIRATIVSWETVDATYDNVQIQ